MTARSSVLAVLAATASVHPAATQAQAQPERLMRGVADASRSELEAFEAGNAFIKTLSTSNRRELVQVYAVRVGVPADFLLDQIRRGHLLLDNAEGEASRGFFSDPPSESDLERLTLSRSAYRALEACRPQACDLKLPAATIERMHEEVDWSGSTAQEDANRFFRQALARVMSDYVRHGDAAGLIYDDKPEPLVVADGFRRLFSEASELQAVDESFARHLAAYPEGSQGAIEDLFTWTIEDLGTKSLVSLNHIALKADETGRGVSIIGIKRLYSGHYFQAGLRVIVVGSLGGGASEADSFVFVVDRRRFDGELGGLRRTATERRLERHAESVLATLKNRVEIASRR